MDLFSTQNKENCKENKYLFNSMHHIMTKRSKQAGAELCQAQQAWS